ncbi:MAG: bacterial Ig-like domain-containing protein, partial [Clostridia bacterium]|nr:bacterial Ig-like domain-containing protein [Clostridia bacterium]
TSEEWNCVNILEGNDYLKNAVVYYNSTGISGGIISRPISFVAISTLPTKREYVLGEKLDLTGGKIAVGYPEGNYEIFDLHDAVISDYDTNKTGYQIITVTYKGHITEFTVAFFKNGDLDGDENINATDVAMLRINLLVNSDHNTRCDINKDGTTDIRDLVNLKKKTVEIIA